MHRVANQYNMWSHGCPVCVWLIKQDVQAAINSGTKIGKHGKRVRTHTERKPYGPRREEIKSSEGIAATGVEVTGA